MARISGDTILLGMNATLNPDEVEMAITGQVRVFRRQGGGLPDVEVSLQLSRDDLQTFRKAQEQRYLLLRKKSKQLIDAWYAWCHAEKIPLIVVHLRKRTATVELDMVTVPYDLSDEALDRILAVLLENSDSKPRDFGPNSTIWCGNSYCMAKRVIPSQAESVAERLVSEFD